TARSCTKMRATRSTIGPLEGVARDDVLPAGGRWGSAASAEVRHAPAGAGHRDARARAGRSEVAALGSGACAPDAGVDPPRALPRTSCTPARGRPARAPWARPALAPGALALEPGPRPGRERRVEPDGDPGGGAHRALRGDRRGPDDVAAQLRASDRRRR